MTLLIRTVLFLVLILALQCNFTIANSIASSESAGQNLFTGHLSSYIVENKSTENVCFSPASVYAALALLYLGSAGNTAAELRKALNLEQEEKPRFATKYGKFFKNTFNKNATADDDLKLKMANRLFVNNGIQILSEFNEIAQSYFDSKVENIDFRQASTAVNKINEWVEQNTENKISNLLQQDALDGDSSAVLVNAIYFKAQWLYPFSPSYTEKEDFHKNSNEKVQVDMMYTNDNFRYVDLRDLSATALEMPYKNSNISMLIILPNDVEGLNNLEQRIKDVDLNEISSRMVKKNVIVKLPKFRIESSIDLKETLNKIGVSSIFSQTADFSELLDSASPQTISDVKHKAYFDCNEAGSEAAAATYIKIVPLSLNFNQKNFIANHPFLFAVRDNKTVYFAGHVTTF